jgi:hypothetical protein
MNRVTYGVVLSLLPLITAGGCGADGVGGVPVSGKITIDGEPIPHGTITFVAADGGTPTGGGVIKDGAYTAKVPPGKKIVLVLGNKLVGKEPLYEGVPDSPMRDKYETLTPPAYNAKQLTPLKADITGPREDLNFELTKDLKGGRATRGTFQY